MAEKRKKPMKWPVSVPEAGMPLGMLPSEGKMARRKMYTAVPPSQLWTPYHTQAIAELVSKVPSFRVDSPARWKTGQYEPTGPKAERAKAAKTM